jgi:hypothetical protein
MEVVGLKEEGEEYNAGVSNFWPIYFTCFI